MMSKGHLTSYFSNILLVLITSVSTGVLTQDMASTLAVSGASLIVAYLDLKNPRKLEENTR